MMMICDCGQDGKHIKFPTFHYWYCEGCKVEIMAKPAQLTKGKKSEKISGQTSPLSDTIKTDGTQDMADEFEKMLQDLQDAGALD